MRDAITLYDVLVETMGGNVIRLARFNTRLEADAYLTDPSSWRRAWVSERQFDPRSRAPNNCAPWPQFEVARLVEHLEPRVLSYREIGVAMGKTKNEVIGKAARLGYGKEPDPERRPTIEFPPSGRCLYPHGNPGEADSHFCGASVAFAGSPYCPEHRSLCVVAGSQARRELEVA